MPLACGDEGDETAATTEDTPAQAEREQAGRIKSHIAAKDVVKAFPPSIVKDGDVAAQKEGSPGRAFLEWWQACQFKDVGAVLALTSRATLAEVGRRQVAKLVRLTQLQGVQVLDVREDGDAASVNAGLLTFQAEKGEQPPTKPTSSQPATFAMRREGGRWVFADTGFLTLKLDNLKR